MAPILNVTINNASYVTPGYIFICPYWTDQSGPYIYATNGVSFAIFEVVELCSDYHRTSSGAASVTAVLVPRWVSTL